MHLPIRISLPLAALVSLVVPSLSWADPGVLDRYDCHNDAITGEYHCHGSEGRGSLGGFAIGAGLRSSIWVFTESSEYEAFIGPSIDVEAGLGSFALQGSYHYKQLVTGSADVNLVGWDLGAKIGSGVARFGRKLYGNFGYFNESVQQDGLRDVSISGFYIGAGGGYNWEEVGLDFQADWHLSEGFTEFANDEETRTFSIRSVVSYRF